ncbi:MAG: carboxymuconolactone decarboxylase family protein [Streptomycetaceae bacterium]|jgi:AhpD family alkylhydroperoxidase|nr:carboxymuconolactone decarboxylase family protein [Streptomycetaceae bacterium]
MTAVRIPQRLHFPTVAPKVFKAVLALDGASRDGLDPVVRELVQLRASLLNRCAYCLDYHTNDARKAGESEDRLLQLAAWHDASVFTARERAALALADALTLLPGGIPDDVFDTAAAHFEERELAQLIAMVATANVWNRINVACRVTPGNA